MIPCGAMGPVITRSGLLSVDRYRSEDLGKLFWLRSFHKQRYERLSEQAETDVKTWTHMTKITILCDVTSCSLVDE
jgi:hypothetical protein